MVTAFLTTVRTITPDKADRIVAPASDHRTLAQIMGHIADWEQYMIFASGGILAAAQHPRMITTVDGFIDTDWQPLSFSGIDAFNAHHAQNQAQWPWAQLQALAVDTAATLHVLLTHPPLLTASRLSKDTKVLLNGRILAG